MPLDMAAVNAVVIALFYQLVVCSGIVIGERLGAVVDCGVWFSQRLVKSDSLLSWCKHRKTEKFELMWLVSNELFLLSIWHGS